jgi:toxin ParE1/3/4
VVSELRFTDRFDRDLEEIGDFIALDKPRAAAQFIEAIRRHCSLLAAAPLIGQARPDIAPAIRSFPYRRYHVFYRYRADLDQVEILRVWHGRRRLPSRSDLGVFEQEP